MNIADYHRFLLNKQSKSLNSGKIVSESKVHHILFDWQRHITIWAIRKGRCAIFLDTGLGKTFIQLEWARLLSKKCLIIAPLSVARQTIREAKKIDLNVNYVRGQDDIVNDQIYVTNYEMIEQFDYSKFDAVVLDESSILKSIGSKTRQLLTKLCYNIPYKLCCTATPAPNDYIEIGNHAEFLGICKQSEMQAMFFVNANKDHTFEIAGKIYYKKGANVDGTEWRLKHHAEIPFFKWLSTWAITMTKPSDLGYNDDGFILPKLNITPHFVGSEYIPDGQIVFTGLHGITDRIKVRQETLPEKLDILKGIVKSNTDKQWIIWCGLDSESNNATKLLNATEVKGNDDIEYKTNTLQDFQDRKIRILVTKPKIAGFGMNFQNSSNAVFLGLNDSWETYYQAIRRQWRYGQKLPVDIHIIMHNSESEIYQNILRKDAMANRLRQELILNIKGFEKEELNMNTSKMVAEIKKQTEKGDGWIAMLGDSCERLSEITDGSIDLSIYSPPFADLYTYSNSERDLGNCKDWEQFFGHYKFIVRELLRVTKQGRLSCVHTSDIAAMAQKDGYIGIKDFPGEVIRLHEKCGWTFFGRCFIQKNPQAQAIRVKSKALLFVQMRKDSSDSRPALIDQVLIFKKPGENTVAVKPVDNGELDNETWIEWAHGIWLGINETGTLQFTKARALNDEKHIAPLQLGTIERCIKLYSNPGEMILTPFGGIGSEAYMAIKLGRKATLIELKPEYYKVAVDNLKQVSNEEKSRIPLVWK